MSALTDLQEQVSTLKDQVTDLQTSIDAEQQAIADLLAANAQVVTDLNAKIAELEAAAANSISATDAAAIVADLKGISDNIVTEKSDIEGTV